MATLPLWVGEVGAGGCLFGDTVCVDDQNLFSMRLLSPINN
jgi:hypothetical protein